MGAMGCIGSAILAARFSAVVGDLFAYAGLALIGATLVRALWNRFRHPTDQQQPPATATAVSKETASPWFWLAVCGALAAFVWLYLAQMFVVNNPNAEAMDTPMTVAYAQMAKAQGRKPSEFFRDDRVWGHLKQQDRMYTCPPTLGGRIFFEWFALLMPVANALYLPIVKCVGLSYRTIAWYSTLLAGLAWIATAALAWRVWGRWIAVLAALLMACSLLWVIHVRVGYAAWMPSVLFLVLLGGCLYEYCTEPSRRDWMMVASGVLLGLLYLMGWIGVVFGAAWTLAVVVLCGPGRIGAIGKHLFWCGGAAVLTAAALAWAWAVYYGYTAAEVHRVIYEQMFGRFQQGEPGLLNLSFSGRMAYAFRCLFLDSRTLDGHVDKYLEGYPAIPWLFAVSLVIGLLQGIRAGDVATKIFLLWLLVVGAVLGAVFIYGHRYALLALPAMSIVAANGIRQVYCELWQRAGKGAAAVFAGLVAVALALTAVATHRQYYVQYTHRKTPDFEMDRMRGHHEFSEWLKKTGSPQDTLVVMSDPVMFPHRCFLFHTFGWDYPYVYWSNYFRTGSAAEQVRQWERQMLGRYRRIVYAFSPTLLGDPQQGIFMNDPRPFLVAHPEARPVWTYSYAGRAPSVWAFVVER